MSSTLPASGRATEKRAYFAHIDTTISYHKLPSNSTHNLQEFIKNTTQFPIVVSLEPCSSINMPIFSKRHSYGYTGAVPKIFEYGFR